MNIIAIDCGASFIKSALFRDGEIITQLQESAPAINPDSDIYTPTQIEALIPIVRRMVQALSCDLNELTLAISSEMHGFILAHDDGSAFTDYISWQKALCPYTYTLDILRNSTDWGGGITFLAPVCHYAPDSLHAISHI